ncbi:MAG: DNA recombination protein RmuC [Proteobacteria bacterium]|nr:DNA recombination protein RmuC [Pseudomonadota bacterium]MBS0463572.1 DNA recombination protein RmuC [Pseudomonadota bacterium]
MDWLLIVIVGLLLAALALLWMLWRRDGGRAVAAAVDAALDARTTLLRQDLERLERGLRDDLRGARGETQAALAAFDARLGQFTQRTDAGLNALRQNLGDDARRGREESTAGLQRFSDALQARLEKLNETTERRLGEVRATLEARLKELQADNAGKLELMRATVDEKLQATLEARLGESFRLVSERLEQVQRGLGEMQGLAGGVNDLKRVLGNVKARGVFGEAQLAAILEQILTPDQYAANVAVRADSNERVEFAIRLPGAGGAGDAPVWLPIDAKFPREDYERLLEAQDKADSEAAAKAGDALERRVRDEAKTIAAKYVAPPHTTDFAILFLPTEGLYAEVLRRPGLVDGLFRAQRVVVAGPTTLAATLNSLRMGFRTLAIEQRSSEVWQVLGAVKTEFGNFASLLERTKKQLDTVSNSIDRGFVRTRAIARKLRDVEAASDSESQRLLGDALAVDEADPAGDVADAADENGAG